MLATIRTLKLFHPTIAFQQTIPNFTFSASKPPINNLD